MKFYLVRFDEDDDQKLLTPYRHHLLLYDDDWIDNATHHDELVQKENKRHEKLEITTKDPIEAARQYQEIMLSGHA